MINCIFTIMPFTFAHPAVIIPFLYIKKKFFSTTGLIVGSIVPDFEYFLRLRKETSYYSHSWNGLFWFDLPFGLLICFVFHTLIRNPLISNLPAPFQKRFYSFCQFNWNLYFKKYWSFILVSIMIGAGFHIFWDFFVHNSSNYLYSLYSTKKSQGKIISERNYYYILWSTNSLIGVIAIIIYVLKIHINEQALVNTKINGYWIILQCFTIFFSFVRIYFDQYLSIEDIIVSITSAFLLSLILVSLLKRIKSIKIIYPSRH